MTRPTEWPAFVKFIITLLGLAAGTVVFAYNTFETKEVHDKDVYEVRESHAVDRERMERTFEHIDRDLHEILKRTK